MKNNQVKYRLGTLYEFTQSQFNIILTIKFRIEHRKLITFWAIKLVSYYEYDTKLSLIFFS